MFVELVDASCAASSTHGGRAPGSHLRARPGVFPGARPPRRRHERVSAAGAMVRPCSWCTGALRRLVLGAPGPPARTPCLRRRPARPWRTCLVDLATVGIEACVEAVVEDAGGWDDIVLVGHSLAGVVLPAQPPPSATGWPASSSSPPPSPRRRVRLRHHEPELHESVVANLVDGIYRPEGPSAASYLCNDMDDDATAFTLACRVAESVRLLAEPVDLTATRLGAVHLRAAHPRCDAPARRPGPGGGRPR